MIGVEMCLPELRTESEAELEAQLDAKMDAAVKVMAEANGTESPAFLAAKLAVMVRLYYIFGLVWEKPLLHMHSQHHYCAIYTT